MDTTARPPESSSRQNVDANPKKAGDTKRVLACGTCRKRKLKCDSKRPKCSTCDRLGHPCEYDEVRKKSGPKRGYVKSLEARLNQLETLLDKNRESGPEQTPVDEPSRNVEQQPLPSFAARPPQRLPTPPRQTDDLEVFPQATMTDQDLGLLADFGGVSVDGFSWDMVSLGLEEPLPSQAIMDELYQIYFGKVHTSIPMLHRTRFMASLNLAPSSRPPVCLRYIIFALACSVETRYTASGDQFYEKSRKYIEQDEMRGHGESFVSVAHAQCWTLIAVYEFKHMYFPRAWLSVGRAGRLVQLLGLHRQDHAGLDVKQTLGPPKDWAEREERRRTFWAAYCNDRYASIGTGWPMMFDENDILTDLPASDSAFSSGVPERTPQLSSVMTGDQIGALSSFGCVIIMATLFGRNLTHLHRPSTDENDHDLNGEFWKRHRSLDNILLNISLTLPTHLRLPQGIADPNIVFSNMEIHTSAICLHQAAIFKADKHKLAAQISAESKRRCLVAADQITNLMKMISHQDLSGLNPFLAFSLYVAARVFVQYLKFKKGDLTIRSSLMFLLHAMHALKVGNPLTESFLVQLDVDLEGSGLDIPLPVANVKLSQRPLGDSPVNTDALKCPMYIDVRDASGHPRDPSQDKPSHIPSQFTTSEFDSNSYFTGQGPGQILNNGMTPSSSNSNQPTPSGSSDPRRASSSATSPSEANKAGCASTNANPPPHRASENMFLYNNKLTNGDGLVPGQFDMNMGSDGLSKTAPVERPQAQHHLSDPDIQHTLKTMPYNMNMDSEMGQDPQFRHTQSQDPMSFDLNMDSTGLDPMPLSTGFTPGPTGLTPGNFGTTPMSEWASLNMAEGNDWMFDQ